MHTLWILGMVVGLAAPALAGGEHLEIEPAQVQLVPGARARFRAYLVQPDGARKRVRAEFSAPGGKMGRHGDFVAGGERGTFTITARSGIYEGRAKVKVGKARPQRASVAAGPGKPLTLKAWKQPSTDRVAFTALIRQGSHLEIQGVAPSGRLHLLRTWEVKPGDRVAATVPFLPGAYVALAVHLVDARGRRLAEHRARLRR
ncbi:MAG: hypothetical protein KC613_06890 [Myxococcales bacterium]|nr:hypothetical protein [Myxococcales bacterium]